MYDRCKMYNNLPNHIIIVLARKKTDFNHIDQ